MSERFTRRKFLSRTTAALGAFAVTEALERPACAATPAAKADSVIFIWLPGGVSQMETWDPKPFTPYRKGMRGNELFSTCDSIPTAADGIRLGAGLPHMAQVMQHATVVRSIANEAKFGALHLKAQYYMMTGYVPPSGVRPPSMGSVVSRVLGRRQPQVPGYIYIGRDIDTNDAEKLFISEFIGPGFYGANHAPFMIPDPGRGVATLNAFPGMPLARLDQRLSLARLLAEQGPKELREAPRAQEFRQQLNEARALMDSPVKKAFDFAQEKPATLAAYEPEITREQLLDKNYYHGKRFGQGLLLARRLVESGARFVQVEYQYGPFLGFDVHANGAKRMVEMKQQIDRPIAQLIKDLDQRGLLKRTLVVVASEFGRTIASAPSAGTEPEGFAEKHTGAELVIENEEMYGLHGHFSSTNAMLLFGGGFKGGYVYGKTAAEHPMVPIENAVRLEDVHATIYQALGIAPDVNFVTEGRPFYVTKDGKGKPVMAMLA
ncbi:MAG TPA: DUF1501 domain-containing protein [Verrucomicrobiae bacterium]